MSDLTEEPAARRAVRRVDSVAQWVAVARGERLLRTAEELVQLIDGRATGRISTANVQHMYLSAQGDPFRQAFMSADWWTADGWPLVRAIDESGVRRVTGKGLCADLTQPGRLRPLRYALLGGNEQTCAAFQSRVAGAGHVRVWCDHGRFDQVSINERADALPAAGADLVLLALDAYKAELLGALLRGRATTGVIIGVGGGVGMAAGTAPAAPRQAERLGLEWAYRLVREPRRLWKRYLVEYPQVAVPLLRAMARSAAKRRGLVT